MAATTKRLSARFVDTTTEPGLHADGDGLYLNVSPKGAKRWVYIFFFKAPGRSQSRREMSLGKAGALTLAEARAAAEDARRLVARGIDPIAAREEAKRLREEEAKRREVQVETFGSYADKLVDTLASEFRNAKHIEQWRMSLRDYCKPIRGKRLDEIDTEEVMSVLTPIWQTKPETASRVRGRIEKVLDAARADGLRSGENPARWRGHLRHKLPKRQKLSRGHHSALPYSDMPALMARLRESGGMGATALRFLILTAARTGEVIGARWPEVDFETKIWTVPPQRMKAAKTHRVALSDTALEILKTLHETRSSEFIFPGQKDGKPISNMTMTKALRLAGGADYTVHGMRSTFRDFIAEQTSFPNELAELALAHVIPNATERAYRRGDMLTRRFKMMQAWEGHCNKPPVRQSGDNVVPMNRTA